MSTTIERAHSNDSEVLTAITKASKAHWGYSDTQIELWSEQLTITKPYIETNPVYKLVIDDKIAGYYSFYNEDEQTVKLDNLFILPEYIGKGFGKLLLNDLLFRLKSTNVKKVMLHSEPNAEMFYTKFGFVKTGQVETSIKDRHLPVMEMDVV